MTLARYLGIPSIPDIELHERDRALQRVIVCAIATAVWTYELWVARFDAAAYKFGLMLSIGYFLVTAAYVRLGKLAQAADRPILYAFLILDPLFFVSMLAIDPRSFAFLHPFLLIIIVRSGIRYGLRTMYLSWGMAVASSPLLLVTGFWRDEISLTLSYCSMLLCVPIFFAPLTRRIHKARAIEEDRARVRALQDTVAARSAFLAKVSHELRSPLQGIVSALDVLAMRRGPGADADLELIGRIRRSSLLLNTHLRDLLTLAKGEAGRLEMRPEAFDACALVENVAASALDLARDRRLDLVVDLPARTMFAVADGARIDQILTNLVINSIRYTESGRVRLALAPYDAEARSLRFTVADTGPGIPESMLLTVLNPDRAVTGPERRGEGSGMGLAIVRTLVDHLGGRIQVSSRVGTGTQFTVDIPAEPVDLDDEEEPPRTAAAR